MCQPPVIPTKRCGACGEEKASTDYSKKQWMAKSTRRCKVCVEAGVPVKEETAKAREESYCVAPPPKPSSLTWDLYYLLLGAGRDDVLTGDKKDAYTKATKGLTEAEIRQDAFEDRADAALAATRGMALLETPAGPDGPPAAFLLVSRATLWLARDALRRRPLEIDPALYEKLHEDGGVALQYVLKAYTLSIRKFPHAAPLALGLYAHACVRMVASADSGQFTRPSWGEAWLARAECEVFLSELHAAALGKANGKRPPGRRGPWDDDAAKASFFDEAELLAAEHAWEVEVPGHATQRVRAPGAAPPRTHLADYWWGLDKDVATASLVRYSNAAVHFLDLAKGNAHDAKDLDAMRARIRDCECAAFRRGAAALCALGAGADALDERLVRTLDRLRSTLPGSPFEATDGFAKALPREDGPVSLWAVAHVDGAVVVVDCGGDAPHAGAVLELREGAGDADAVREALLNAMAGAGGEARCLAGPPRRPRAVEFHADLADAHAALASDLEQAFDVSSSLAKAGPRRAAFKAARALRGDKALAFAAGDAVRVDGLTAKAQHNGRKGEVAKWLPEKGRYEVRLDATADLAETSLALKVENISIVG